MTNRTRLAVAAALAAASLVPTARRAEAQASRDFYVCGGNAFNTCAAVLIRVTPTATAGLSDVALQVWNLSGLGGTWGATVFTKIGFYNTGDALALAPLTMSGPVRNRNGVDDTPAQWQISDPNSAGGVSLEMTTSANGGNSGVKNSIANACDPANLPGGVNQLWQNPCAPQSPGEGDDGWITFNFQVQGTWNLATTEMLIQGQNGPNGASTQCITGQNCSVVPEPSTFLLLATGLFAVTGYGLHRRRENDRKLSA